MYESFEVLRCALMLNNNREGLSMDNRDRNSK